MAKKKGRGRAKVNKSCPKQDKPNNSIDDHDVVATSLADTTLETTKPKGKRKRTNEKIVAMRLSDYPKLTKADLMCPICWSTLFEPTTLPCNHSICETCFRKHMEETSLCCPCCRLRLSVWCRKVVKEGKLLDEPLWERMKREFPRLVDARFKGLDTQNIMGDEEEDEPSSSQNSSIVNENRVMDGTFCEKPGQIKAELQEMMNEHEKDLEAERLREETESANLIKQLQDEENIFQQAEAEDLELAKRLQEEFGTQANTQQQAPVQRNLVKEWASIGVSPSAKTAQRIPSSTPGSSKGKSKATKRNSSKRTSATVTSFTASRASQDVMSRFLSSSQNQLCSVTSPNSSRTFDTSPQPCCSKSFTDHDIRYSAFSPTKPSSSFRLIVPAESLSIPISSATENIFPVVDKLPDISSTKTPDSIHSEVDRYFRPIRQAPKTPPRRRPDGTFLPDPKPVKTTPKKPLVPPSIAAYIRSPLKQMPDETRPLCLTLEKRISNDSGRASDDSRSPNVDRARDSPSVKGHDDNLGLNAYPNDRRGCVSEDYRVTPDDSIETPEKSKKRVYADVNGNDDSFLDNKKAKVESPEKFNMVQVKQECSSPSLMDDPFGHAPLSFDIACTQGIITIDEDDEEYLEMERKALEECKKKAEQEAADRAFAEKLQKDFNVEARTVPQRGKNSREKYSLRGWLNKTK